MDVNAMMSTTVNAIFQHAMNRYNENNSQDNEAELIASLKKCIARDADWYVPLDVAEEEIQPGDGSEALLLDGLPNNFTKLLLKDEEEGRLYWSFYTSENKIKVPEGRLLKTVKYSARQFAEDIAGSDIAVGVRINNGTDNIQVPLSVFQSILEELEEPSAPAEGVRGGNCLIPYGSIDTNAILTSWKKEWNEPEEDGDDPTIENWKLVAYPIQADGTALLVFQMDALVQGGTAGSIHVTHTVSYYRVLQYDLKGEPKLLGKYRFKIQDGVVNTVFFHDGKLKAVVRGKDGFAFSVLHMWPGSDDESQFKVGSYVTKAMMSSNGELLVGYDSNLYDDAHKPVCMFDADGEFSSGYRSEEVLRCSTLTFDEEENVWLHLFPNSQVVKLNLAEKTAEHLNVQLQGFREMALTGDGKSLYTSYTDSDTETLIYRLSQKESGYFGPVLQKVLILDENADLIDPTDCRVYGNPVMMKSKMLFNVNGVLWAFDFNEQ